MKDNIPVSGSHPPDHYSIELPILDVFWVWRAIADGEKGTWMPSTAKLSECFWKEEGSFPVLRVIQSEDGWRRPALGHREVEPSCEKIVSTHLKMARERYRLAFGKLGILQESFVVSFDEPAKGTVWVLARAHC